MLLIEEIHRRDGHGAAQLTSPIKLFSTLLYYYIK